MEHGDFGWAVCPICGGLMIHKRGQDEPDCDRCKQGIQIPPKGESETNH